MKKTLFTLALAAAMALGVTACGSQGSDTSGDAGSSEAQSAASGEFATIGDVLAADYSDYISVYDETSYKCAFCLDGVYYHVVADLPEGAYDSLNAAEFDDEKIAEVLADVAVTEQEVIAESAPTQDEVDALVGKTGAEVVAEGYTIDSAMVNEGATDCNVSKAPFTYMVTFDGAIADEETTDYAGAVKDLKVASASFAGLAWGAL